MKKILTTLAAILCCAITISAQDAQTNRNRTYRITLGNVQYAHHNEKMSAGDAVGKVLDEFGDEIIGSCDSVVV